MQLLEDESPFCATLKDTWRVNSANVVSHTSDLDRVLFELEAEVGTETVPVKMEDIFHWIRKGDAIQVRMWLDDTEHDMNQGYVRLRQPGVRWFSLGLIHAFLSLLFSDDHQFSPLHWAAKGGHTKIVEMLIVRGARVHTTNMGDDTPLHLAAAHGHRDIVNLVRGGYRQRKP